MVIATYINECNIKFFEQRFSNEIVSISDVSKSRKEINEVVGSCPEILYLWLPGCNG